MWLLGERLFVTCIFSQGKCEGSIPILKKDFDEWNLRKPKMIQKDSVILILHIVSYNWGLRFSSQCCWKSESATIYHYILSQNKIFQWKIGISVKFTRGLGSVKTKKCPKTGGIITPEVALLLSLLQIKYLMGFLNYSIKHKS